MQNLVVISDNVCTHVGGPKILGRWAHLLQWGMAEPRETCSCYMCYTKFGRSRSNCLGVGRGSRTSWGRWGRSPWDGERG